MAARSRMWQTSPLHVACVGAAWLHPTARVHEQEDPGPPGITVMSESPSFSPVTDPQHTREKRVDDSPLSPIVSAKNERPATTSDQPSWMPEPGNDVIGACGHKIGEIVDQEPGHIVVEVGFFNPTDLYIPTSVISGHHGDDVTLSVSKDEALHRGWDHDPLEDE